jgi:hypothetical protein
MQTYQTGDQVHISLGSVSAPATVVFVSTNGRNLVLKAGGFFYGAPIRVVWTDDDGWHEINQGGAVEIRPIRPGNAAAPRDRAPKQRRSQ